MTLPSKELSMPVTTRVYVGTYTKESKGIYLYHLNPATGELTYESAVEGIQNPSFLDIHPNGQSLYSVSEVGGDPGGAIAAFSIDPSNGHLAPLNQVSSCGKGPCHLSIDATGSYVLAANYSSGSVAMIPIKDDGSLGEPADSAQHEGSSADPSRQKGPHAHSITVAPDNRFAYAADLGLDQILVYELDYAAGKLVPQLPVTVQPAAGPRHFAFHPNGAYGYLINELDNTFVAYSRDAATGTLTELQVISTLPEGFSDTSYCADVHVSADGRFLYGSNRGHDSIAIYAINGDTGKVSPVGYESTQGKFPRNFGIDPSGSCMLVANQNTDDIVSYHINKDSGTLKPTGHVTKVGAPVCVKMVAV